MRESTSSSASSLVGPPFWVLSTIAEQPEEACAQREVNRGARRGGLKMRRQVLLLTTSALILDYGAMAATAQGTDDSRSAQPSTDDPRTGGFHGARGHDGSGMMGGGMMGGGMMMGLQ